MANYDFLGRTMADYGGMFSSDAVKLTFAKLGTMSIPFIVTQLGLNYGQQVGRFYGLNENKVFLVSGRANGNGTLQQVLAPNGDLGTFFSRYGQVCNVRDNELHFTMGTGSNCAPNASGVSASGSTQFGERTFIAKMVLINQLGITLSSENPAINNNCQMTYEGLEYAGTGVASERPPSPDSGQLSPLGF